MNDRTPVLTLFFFISALLLLLSPPAEASATPEFNLFYSNDMKGELAPCG